MLGLSHHESEIYFPDQAISVKDLSNTTHLGIGAHQDDLEILAIHGILEAYDDPEKSFTGVTVTDGRGAPRNGPYADTSDEDLWQIRGKEQKKAADIGNYLAQFLLNHPSQIIKSPQRQSVVDDIKFILGETVPTTIYTHNLADKHDTHVAVALSVIQALRELDPPLRNIRLLGCEVWRGLDWLPDEMKITLDVSKNIKLQQELLSVFESQIIGGKRYDLATMGRRLANATFYQSHHTDQTTGMVYAMEMTPLILQPEMPAEQFVDNILASYANDVRKRLCRLRKDPA